MESPLFDSMHFVIAPALEAKAHRTWESMTISSGELE